MIAPLRPPGGRSITVFSALFNKAVLLSSAFALDPYNPMVLYPTGPLKFPSWAKSGLSVTFWQCIMKHSSLFFQYLVHGARDSANAAQPTVTPLNRHWQETNISSMSRPEFLILIFVKKYSIFHKHLLYEIYVNHEKCVKNKYFVRKLCLEQLFRARKYCSRKMMFSRKMCHDKVVTARNTWNNCTK